MTFTWTWNATTKRLTLVCTGLAATTNYALLTRDKLSGGAQYLADATSDGGGGLTVEMTDLVPMGPGSTFSAIFSEKATAVVLAVNVFTANVSSSGDGLTATFSHDGANGYSVQIQTENGRTYLFEVSTQGATGGGGGMTWVGNGTLETKTLDVSATPIPGGSSVLSEVSDWDGHQTGNGGPTLAVGLQVQGSAGASTGDNPGGGTYNPAFVGVAEASEGSWVFSYNGTTTLTAVGSGLVPGRLYGLALDGCSTHFVEAATADGGGNATITQTGITDPFACFGGGPGMQAIILGGPLFSLGSGGYTSGGIAKAAKIFQYGTPSAGTDGIGTWVFDGVEFGSVTFPTTLGVVYDVERNAGAADIIDIDGPVTGDGGIKTINWRITNPSINNENAGLFSQTPVTLFNSSVYEDLGGLVFTYGDVFPALVQPVLVSSPPWRLIVTDLDSATITLLDRLATQRAVSFAINQSAPLTCDVPSDNPEINILHTDGDPFVSYSNRLIYGFRREGHPTPWVVRYAGILMMVEREAAADEPVTHISAWDPWQYWSQNRPIVNGHGVLPGRGGLTYTDSRGSVIAINLLGNALAAHGTLFADFGQTPYYQGTIEATDVIADINFQQSTTLGDALTQLTDTGTLDIVLTPIYDPIRRPGILVEVSIYAQAGTRRNGAIFAWDMPSRSLSGIDLLHDGTQLANRVAFWTSAANQPVPIQSDVTSETKYKQYWFLKSLSVVGTIAAAELLALAQVVLRRRGKTTLTIDPSPERSPVPFNEYSVGDEVPVYASTDLGEAVDAGAVVSGHWSNLQRIYAMPLTISDDDVETVVRLLLTDSNGSGV